MGASSVTGHGLGSAFPGVKGPGNGRNVGVPQVNPHVVAAGNVALVAGAATITFPNVLPEAAANYVVLLTPVAAHLTTVGAKTNVDSQFSSFTIVGTGTDTVGWVVVKAGYGLDVTA